MAQFKYRGDAELIKAIREKAVSLFKKEFKNTTIVPIPLSEERHYERGFNQSFLIAQLLKQPMFCCLHRPIHEEKQSKKGREDRLEKQAVFTFNESFKEDIRDKEITLVDDIYTTGATLEAAGKILLDKGALSITSFTVARG
ncbi:ComF family protein [Pseudalkalibacillus berkeleyi]|uniref:ComF family protein n=1 Tax=Pseudalkalibacillus berkeleyi TaxID=1069813 RepID=A0ABS9H3W2_9BACL|nr:phosphoribosyltransferase family protein [Pseudalkalibacillus berkeleyi]MCF6138761.1 ComF family protein [Pseudalkalibacillus berkeleyi]